MEEKEPSALRTSRREKEGEEGAREKERRMRLGDGRRGEVKTLTQDRRFKLLAKVRA